MKLRWNNPRQSSSENVAQPRLSLPVYFWFWEVRQPFKSRLFVYSRSSWAKFLLQNTYSFSPGMKMTIKYGLPIKSFSYVFFFLLSDFYRLLLWSSYQTLKMWQSLFHCKSCHDSRVLSFLQMFHVNTTLSQLSIYLPSKYYQTHEANLNLLTLLLLQMSAENWELPPPASHMLCVSHQYHSIP